MTLPVAVCDARYHFSDFNDFLTLYDQIGNVVRTAKDLTNVAHSYLSKVSVQGTLYVEFMISPGHSMANGIDFPSQISAIAEALKMAEAESGIRGNIIVTCVRHRGPEEAIEIAEMASNCRHKMLRGFGLTGNERVFDIEAFKGAFLVAKDAGLGLTAHVGEWTEASEVLRAVNVLNLQRVGHGVSISEEPTIMSELSERKVGFEVCLSSNVHLGASSSFAGHQARRMLDAGCAVAFSTDDPSYFETTPENELSLATEHLSLSPTEQLTVFRNSVDMAFCDDETKRSLLIRLPE